VLRRVSMAAAPHGVVKERQRALPHACLAHPFRFRSVEWRKSTVANCRFATSVGGSRSPARDPPHARDSAAGVSCASAPTTACRRRGSRDLRLAARRGRRRDPAGSPKGASDCRRGVGGCPTQPETRSRLPSGRRRLHNVSLSSSSWPSRPGKGGVCARSGSTNTVVPR
jgi:hypothetical protein